MSSNRIILEEVLDREVCLTIDHVCRGSKGMGSLPGLASFLHEHGLATIELDKDIIEGYIVDGSNLPGFAHGLARPRTIAECAAVFRACFMAGIPFTLSAGRSNLTGSATPQGGVIVSLDHFNHAPVRTDIEARRVWCPAGIILEDMRNLVKEQNNGRLIFPVDPTSRSDAMVGGAVSCNASGFTPGETGAMRHWVSGIEVLMPDGHLIRAERGQYWSKNGVFVLVRDARESLLPVPRYARPLIKNASGPFSSPDGIMDFVDLIIGSEGIFGMVTGCTLALKEHPGEYLDLFFPLPDEGDAIDFLAYLRNRLESDFSVLTACEYFGSNCRKYMNHEQKFFSTESRVGIYLQIPIREGSLDEAAGTWLEIISGSPCKVDANRIRVMANDRDRTLFMDARHSLPANAIEIVRQRGTYTILTDTSVPHERFREFLDYTNTLIRSNGVDYLSFGHLGDCHLHFTLLPQRDQLEKAAHLYDLIVDKASELGGVYSGEHGTGKRKQGDFLKRYGTGAVEEVQAAKAGVDPLFLLNRGNVVESPA